MEDSQDMEDALKETLSEADQLTKSELTLAVYYQRLADRTRERQRKELASLRTFLEREGKHVGNLALDAEAWGCVTSEDIARYLIALKEQNYIASSLTNRLYTIRTYAQLAMEAGFLSGIEYQGMTAIEIEADKAGQPRIGKQKSDLLELSKEQVQFLLTQPETRRGLIDKLLMCLLLFCGLWPREIAALTRSAFDLERGTLRFYNYYAEEEQIINLGHFTLDAAKRYLQDASPYEALFVGNRREDIENVRLSDRAVNARVRTLGKQIGISNLSPRDCHNYWANHRQEQYQQPLSELADREHSPEQHRYLQPKIDQVSIIPKKHKQRKIRPDVFNRRPFEDSLRRQNVPESLIAPIVSDYRLLMPLLIREVGEAAFFKIALEHRNELKLGPQTDLWKRAIHHIVAYADEEIESYIKKKEEEE
jgi:integrase